MIFLQVVHVWPCLTTNFQQIPEALCRDQRNRAAGTLDQRIRADRGAVRQSVDLVHRDFILATKSDQAIQYGVCRI